MKRMISLLILIFCAHLLCGCVGQKSKNSTLERIKLKKEIVVGIKTDSKPFGFVENGEIKGFDADVARYISKTLFGLEDNIVFVPVDAQSRIEALNTHKVDMVIATMSITPSRSEVVDFTIPYYIAGQVIMVRNDSKIRSINDLNNKNVVFVLGTTGERTLRQLAPNAKIIGSVDYNDAFNKLKNNEVEAILADDSLLYGFIMDNPGYKILPKRYAREYYAIAVEKSQNEELKKVLNNVLQNMQESGTLHRVRQKWTPMSSSSPSPHAE